MWTEAVWQKRLAEERARKVRERAPYFGVRRPVTGSKDKFSLDNIPGPGPQPEPGDQPAGVGRAAIVPEVVEPGIGQEAPPEEGIRHGCAACAKGDRPHRDEKGHFRKGHGTGFGKKGNQNVEIAQEELRAAAPKAVRTLIAALDDKLPWVALTAARTICERVIPAVVVENADQGPVLSFPPGTKMALMAEVADPGPASMAALGERGARSVYGGGPPKQEEQEQAQDVEPDLKR